MALITCKDCKKEFSTDAKRCPHCGAKKVSKHYILKTFVIILFISWMSALTNRTRLYSEPIPTTHVTSTPAPSNAQPFETWRYSSEEDGMTSKNIHFASIESTNTLEFAFPYNGIQHATLQLRTHPQFGKDVILSVEKGQFLCRFDGCSVLVRFDEEKPVSFSAGEPSDNNTTYIFIRGYTHFLDKMLKAKRVRIAAEFYQSGIQTLEFDVSNFDSKQYSDKK